ncbi:hypothetical protein ACHAWF_005202 [Thalassiosira exigua]
MHGTMAVARIHRAALAAAVLGNGCAAFQRSRPSLPPPANPHFVGRGGRQLSWTISDGRPSGCCANMNGFPSQKLGAFPTKRPRVHWLWPRTAMGAIDQGVEAEATEISGAATFDGDCDERDDSDASDDSVEDSRPSPLLEALARSVRSALDGLSKKTASLERELAKAQSLEETMKRANLIVANLYRLPPGTASAEVEDWEDGGRIVELALNTKEYGSAQEEADALFASARKMKRGSKVVEELMQQSLEGAKILEDAMLDLEAMSQNDGVALVEESLVLIQRRLESSSKKTGFRSPKLDESDDRAQKLQSKKTKKRNVDKVRNKPNPREMTSPSGHKVLVGRNRRDNEAICFQLSKPTDVWMHARGCPGAHVLLCVRRGSAEVTDDDLQFAADLAAFYSDARTELRAEITTAAPKHIAKPRGAPMGAVSLRQEGKTLLGRPANVSDDLKEARENSGAAWDESGYRRLGTRAKNKKKTAAVEKAMKDKNREDARSKSKRRKRKEEQDWY